ncbi:MAG: hypothetical protein II859_00115 [Bacteroidales bacterium]|nr:hypothetical protein [Bacteroidales bacterium]
MSLDLYITSKTPIRKFGTGVYVRENGQTVELKTKEDVRSHFPDADLSHILVHEYEDEDFWHGNITHNMNKMASEVPIEGTELTLYDLLWRPDEHNFATTGSPGYREYVLKGYLYLRTHKEELLPLNPDNGWGNYDQLLAFTLDFLQRLIAADDDFEIYATR